MKSRVFKAIENRRNKHHGGRGMTAPATKVLRVPIDILEELDALIWEYKDRANKSPDSPRYHFLRQFLSELDDLLAEDSE